MIYPVICLICYTVVSLVRTASTKSEWLPAISCGLGAVLSLAAFLICPQHIPSADLLEVIFCGALSGLAATGSNQLWKKSKILIFGKYGLDVNALDHMLEEHNKADRT